MKYGSGLQYGIVDPIYTPLEGQDILYENTITGNLWHFDTLSLIWECITCASGGSGISIGNFNLTGVTKGLSLTGSELALHSASVSTPGAVDLADNQVLGDNTKIFQKNTSADADTIILRNNNAVSPNMGSALSFENGGIESSNILSTVTGASYTNGSNLKFSTKDSDGVIRTALEITNQNQTKFNSYIERKTFEFSSNLDHSAFTTRYPRYVFLMENTSLTIPDPANIDIGTEIQYEIGFTTDGNCSITTPAALGIFDLATNQLNGINSVIVNTTNPNGKLTCSKKDGVKYWVVTRGGVGIYNGSGTIPANTYAALESTLTWTAYSTPTVPVFTYNIGASGNTLIDVYNVNGYLLKREQLPVTVQSEPTTETFLTSILDNVLGYKSGMFIYFESPSIYQITNKVRNTGFDEKPYFYTAVSSNINEPYYAVKVEGHVSPVTLTFTYSPQTLDSFTREVTIMNVGTINNVTLDAGSQTWQFMTLSGTSSTTYTITPGNSVRLIFDTQNNKYIIN